MTADPYSWGTTGMSALAQMPMVDLFARSYYDQRDECTHCGQVVDLTEWPPVDHERGVRCWMHRGEDA